MRTIVHYSSRSSNSRPRRSVHLDLLLFYLLSTPQRPTSQPPEQSTGYSPTIKADQPAIDALLHGWPATWLRTDDLGAARHLFLLHRALSTLRVRHHRPSGFALVPRRPVKVGRSYRRLRRVRSFRARHLWLSVLVLGGAAKGTPPAVVTEEAAYVAFFDGFEGLFGLRCIWTRALTVFLCGREDLSVWVQLGAAAAG